MTTLHDLVADFAAGLTAADGKRPQSKRYKPGIGPHDEPEVVRLVLAEMQAAHPVRYTGAAREVPYPGSADRCDLCIGDGNGWDWALEIKAARAMRDNGSPAPEHLKEMLSPYRGDRSLVGDATKVLRFAPAQRRAILVYGYDYSAHPLTDLLPALRSLLALRVVIQQEAESPFDGLVHPVHRRGRVIAWEVAQRPGGDRG